MMTARGKSVGDRICSPKFLLVFQEFHPDEQHRQSLIEKDASTDSNVDMAV